MPSCLAEGVVFARPAHRIAVQSVRRLPEPGRLRYGIYPHWVTARRLGLVGLAVVAGFVARRLTRRHRSEEVPPRRYADYPTPPPPDTEGWFEYGTTEGPGK